MWILAGTCDAGVSDGPVPGSARRRAAACLVKTGVAGPVCGWRYFYGGLFPVVAKQAASHGIRVSRTGANLEAYDTLGGALGAFLTGLFLLPVLGASRTVAFLAALIAVSALPFLLGVRRCAHGGDRLDRYARPFGYTLAGVAVYVLVISKTCPPSRRASRSDHWRTWHAHSPAWQRCGRNPRPAQGSHGDYPVVARERTRFPDMF